MFSRLDVFDTFIYGAIEIVDTTTGSQETSANGCRDQEIPYVDRESSHTFVKIAPGPQMDHVASCGIPVERRP